MSFDQYTMMFAVTAVEKKGDKPNIAPFVEWLRKGRPLDPSVRRWLVALLTTGWHGTQLVLKWKKGGRGVPWSTLKKHVEAHEHYGAMCARKVDQNFASRIATELGGRTRIERRGTSVTHVIEIARRHKPLRLTVGKKPKKADALTTTSKKFKVPEATLLKAFHRIDEARRIS